MNRHTLLLPFGLLILGCRPPDDEHWKEKFVQEVNYHYRTQSCRTWLARTL